MRAFRRIVFPTDFSPASRPAFRKAVALAKGERAQLIVLHVLSALPVMPGSYVSPSVWDDLELGQRTQAARLLRSVVAKAKTAGARASGVLIDFGVTHEQIVRYARKKRADLIVMGTHGRSGLTRALLGSVASRVLSAAKCPVLTVRA
jgi:nucleotide-binding universal stress UspA family protein